MSARVVEQPEVKEATDALQTLSINDDIKTELIRLVTLHARRDHQKYMFVYSETAPKSDLVVEWKKIVEEIPEKYTSQKKQFRISHWKNQMKELAKVDCINKVKWR